MGESSLGPGGYKPNALSAMPRRPSQKEGAPQTTKRHWDRPCSFLFLARRRGAFGTSTDAASLTLFLFSVFLEVEGAILARRRTLGPALQFFCFSGFGTSTGRFWHVDGHWDQPYSFSVFCFCRGRRSNFGTSTDIGTSLAVFLFFCFWHVEGALLARRRTLGPALQFFCFSVFGTSKGRFWHVDGHWDHALQFFCFSVFGTSKGRFWHVDGHWDQPYSFLFSVFLEVEGAILARRRTLGPALQFFCFSVFGTSKEPCWHVDGHWDQPYSFSVFCFWHVEGALLARRRTLGLALQFFCFSVFGTSKGRFWHVDGHWDHAF